jgi:hypothetical protein
MAMSSSICEVPITQLWQKPHIIRSLYVLVKAQPRRAYLYDPVSPGATSDAAGCRGHLSAADLRAIAQWVALNEQAILDHWNGLTDGVQLGQQLRRQP